MSRAGGSRASGDEGSCANRADGSTTVVLLAGGRSRRFPAGDKALADVGGAPMCRRAVAGLPAGELVVNCRDEQRDDLAVALEGHDPRFAVDPVPDCGPLAGLLTALRVAANDRAVVVGCDMPLFDGTTATALLEALDGRPRDGASSDAERANEDGEHADRTDGPPLDAAVVDADGPPSPLGAAYRVEAARRACETTLACGSRRLVDALCRLDVATVAADARALYNCNTPAEVSAAVDAFDSRTLVH